MFGGNSAPTPLTDEQRKAARRRQPCTITLRAELREKTGKVSKRS